MGEVRTAEERGHPELGFAEVAAAHLDLESPKIDLCGRVRSH